MDLNRTLNDMCTISLGLEEIGIITEETYFKVLAFLKNNKMK